MATEENNIVARIMLAAGDMGARLFRNNQGIAKYPNGSTVKYGICNPGGSDLIGWTSMVVTPEMVGSKVAVFTAIEAKTVKGTVSSEQRNFIRVVQEAGGIAGVAKCDEDAVVLIKHWPL